jgi:signal transduction histidine kinase
MLMAASYNYFLVILSIFIAMSAAYAALDLAPRITVARGWVRLAWLTCGAFAVGIGFWSMHFTGMLAFSLPVPVDYDWPTVLLSLTAGVFAAGFSLFVLSQETMGRIQIVALGILVGAALITIHNIGMRAMRMAAEYRYDFRLASVTVMLAVFVSVTGLWLGFRFRDEINDRAWRKIAGALVAGAAISSVHYSAMAAATFSPSSPDFDVAHAVRISTIGAAAIAMATLVIQGLAMTTAFANKRLAEQKAREQLVHWQNEERRRIGRNLHDDIGQGLFAVKLDLVRLRDSVEDLTARKSLSDSINIINASMERVRTISHLMYPPELETLGFRAATIVYVDGFRERSGICVDLNFATPLPHLSLALECALFKVIQESLLNAARHSGSQAVQIQIRVENNQLELKVKDDGRGIPAETLRTLQRGANPGLGSAVMQSRIEELGGQLEITSGAWGTLVKAVIPLPA